MKFDKVTILNVEAKGAAATVRCRRKDSIYKFFCFKPDLISELRMKIHSECDLDIFPLRESEFNGVVEPSKVFICGFYRPRATKKEADGAEIEAPDNKKDLPF